MLSPERKAASAAKAEPKTLPPPPLGGSGRASPRSYYAVLTRVFACFVAALLVEGSAWLGLFVLGTRGIYYEPIVDSLSHEQRFELARVLDGATQYYEYHPTLGWSIRPNGGKQPLYRANAGGFRADHEYQSIPPTGVTRIAAFGDSFTHGDEVRHADTWTARLERPGQEVLNFGVSGYGLDQAYLRYQVDGRRYHAHLVLIGFMTDDLWRAVSVWRPFYNPRFANRAELAKPRFEVDHDTLTLIPNPMRRVADYRGLLNDPATVLPHICAHDYYFHTREHAGALDWLAGIRLLKIVGRSVRQFEAPVRFGRFNPRSEAFRVTVATLAAFVRDVRRDGATPVILLFPSRDDIQAYWQSAVRAYDPLRLEMDLRGMPYLDVVEAFGSCRSKFGVRTLAPGHYTALGNELVAAYLAAHLDRTGIRFPSVQHTPICEARSP